MKRRSTGELLLGLATNSVKQIILTIVIGVLFGIMVCEMEKEVKRRVKGGQFEPKAHFNGFQRLFMGI